MKWLDNNPVAVVLSSIGAGLVLVSLLMAWIWGRPVSPGQELTDIEQAGLQNVPGMSTELGPVSDYQVTNDRPVFNESRRPVVLIADGPDIDIPEITIANAPDVHLTGVVITPHMKLATLSPAKEGDAVIAHEGMPMDGEYVGWTVSSIEPRQVRLESTDGRSFKLELMIHDQMIKQPPKPVRPPEALAGGDADAGDSTGQPMSRAEEIRQRIQERREQLRLEAEAAQDEDKDAEKTAQRTQYQEAIREMMRKRNNDEKDNDER